MLTAFLALPLVALDGATSPTALPALAARAENALAPALSIHAVDAFGRAVRGLELDLVVRGEDGTARTVRCAVGADGRADLSKVEGTVVHASAAGDWFATAQTWWLDGDEEHGLLTVVPRVPMELTLVSQDGEAFDTFAAEVDAVFDLDAANGYAVGATAFKVGGVTTDGTLRLGVPRGHSLLDLWVPGSFAFDGELEVPSGTFAGETTIVEFRATSGAGHRFELTAPTLEERAVVWSREGEPLVGARWTPSGTPLYRHPDFVRAFGGVTDERGAMVVREAVDFEGEAERIFESTFRFQLAEGAGVPYHMSVPAIPPDGFEASIAHEAASVRLPDAPDGYDWTFFASEVASDQRLVATPDTLGSLEGHHQAWAVPRGGSLARGVLHLDGWLWDAYDREVAFDEQRARLDLDGLPAVAWAVEAFDAAVEEDLAYVERYHLTPLDAKGRVRSFAPVTPETAQVHARGPGWCGGALGLEEGEDGALRPVADGELVEVRFVRADGSPAAFVHFAAGWYDLFFAPDRRVGWSDEQGRATIARPVPEEEGGVFCVRFAPNEELPGTVVPLAFDDEGRATVVVPETGSLAIDGVAVVGGDPRPLIVRIASGTEDDGGGDPRDRRDDFGVFTTNPDGTLRVDGLPKGTYRVWVDDVDFFFDGEAKSTVLEVE